MIESDIEKYSSQRNLYKILCWFFNKPEKEQEIVSVKPLYRVKLLCNWMTSEEIRESYSRFMESKYRWGSVEFILEDDCDYYIILNATSEKYIPEKSIVFQMEPHMDKNYSWGEWRIPRCLKLFAHSTDYNNMEWHLSKTYNELLTFSPTKTKLLSTILSSKYVDPGHIKRVDFVKYLEDRNISIDVYGSNRWNYKNYKGSLPYASKDEGIFPYKYTFNAENHSITNNMTEKIVDGILGECLTFYWGCPNISSYIDERAYVVLGLSNFEDDMMTIAKAIAEDWHTQRLPYIKQAKEKILKEMQFCPRLEKFLKSLK